MGKGGHRSSGERGAGGGASTSKEPQSSGSDIREVEVFLVLRNGFMVRTLDDEEIENYVHHVQIGQEEVKNRNASKGEIKKSLEKVAKEMKYKGWIKQVPWTEFTLRGDPSHPKGHILTTIWSMKYVDQRNQTDLDPGNKMLELEQSLYLSSQYRKCRMGDIVYDSLKCEKCGDMGHLERECPKANLERECPKENLNLKSKVEFPDLARSNDSKCTKVQRKPISRNKRQ